MRLTYGVLALGFEECQHDDSKECTCELQAGLPYAALARAAPGGRSAAAPAAPAAAAQRPCRASEKS